MENVNVFPRIYLDCFKNLLSIPDCLEFPPFFLFFFFFGLIFINKCDKGSKNT